MSVSGPALGITGGHCDNNLLPSEFHYKSDGVADGPWAARAKVREVVKYGADVIKICASGGVLSKCDQPGTPQFTIEEMQAIAEEAHKLGRKVAAHAHGTQSIKDAIRAGIDSIEHSSLIDDEGIALANQHGTLSRLRHLQRRLHSSGRRESWNAAGVHRKGEEDRPSAA
jgi:imidazolonepropionase-like amidohydrolase